MIFTSRGDCRVLSRCESILQDAPQSSEQAVLHLPSITPIKSRTTLPCGNGTIPELAGRGRAREARLQTHGAR